jgi:hypothetical protein
MRGKGQVVPWWLRGNSLGNTRSRFWAKISLCGFEDVRVKRTSEDKMAHMNPLDLLWIHRRQQLLVDPDVPKKPMTNSLLKGGFTTPART